MTGFSKSRAYSARLQKIGLLAATLAASCNAFGHAILVKATPEREAVVAEAPGEVLLVFNDAVGQEFLALAVIDETGKRVDKHDATLDFTDHSHLRASVETLKAGRYIVRYRVLSADGHVVSGKYSFQVQPR
jgi:methionine-rich copper-binding protein CopC